MVAMMNALLAAAAASYGSSGSMKSTSGYSSYGAFSALPVGCSLQGFVPQFPHNQTQLVAPTQPARFIGLAFGVQNYTCTSFNNYT